MSPCFNGSSNVPAMTIYAGMTTAGDNACICNTIVYSLLCACDACQGESWLSWPKWSYNCSDLYPTYSPAIPNGTRVPHWAYLDVAYNFNSSWNATGAVLVGGFPENTAGVSSTGATTAGASTKDTSTPAGVSPAVSQSHSSTSSLNHHKSHSGKIAGASAGVLVGILLLIGTIFWYLRRWRSRAEIQPEGPPEPAPFSDSAVRIAGRFGLPDPNRSMAIGRYYDPSDPNTFPKMTETLVETVQNRRNVHNDEPTDSTNRLQYSGLPIV